MPSIERTAYPRFGKRLSAEELHDRYELSDAEQGFIGATANGGRQRLTLAALLKTRQQLGYFPALTAVPAQITEYLSGQLGFSERIALLDHIRLKPTLHRYRNAVRSFLDTKPFRPEDRQHIEEAIRKAAETMSDPRTSSMWRSPNSARPASNCRPTVRWSGLSAISASKSMRNCARGRVGG